MMNAPYSYGSDYMGGRSRAFSFDGNRPGAVVPSGSMSPRYYPSNQPGYGGNTGYGGYQTAYTPQPQYTTPMAYNTGYAQPAYNTQPQYANNWGVTNAACCPAPVQACAPPPCAPATNTCPQASQSAHAFQSTDASQCEGLVHRDVQYETEWVAVPVQKPVVYETYQRKVEVPTQHIVNVQNCPGPVPERVLVQPPPCPTQCAPVCAPPVQQCAPQCPPMGYAPQGGPSYYPRGASWNQSRARAFSM
jgi:hypothetical protein